jgi:hypothetical protein
VDDVDTPPKAETEGAGFSNVLPKASGPAGLLISAVTTFSDSLFDSTNSRGLIIPGNAPPSGLITLNETRNPSCENASNRGAGGKSGTSTPPSIPRFIGIWLVKSNASPKQDVSSFTPFFPAGILPLPVSSNIKLSHGASTPSGA